MNEWEHQQEWVTQALASYEGPLLRYARRITGDEDRARDVVQDTFLKLCRQDRGQLNGQLVQWLYTVCRNRALDVKRKESRMIAVADETMVLVADPQTESQLNSDASEEQSDQIRDWIARLPAKQQECIRLKFQHGLSYKEIAEVIGITETNVGFLIHTGLKTVRERIQAASGGR